MAFFSCSISILSTSESPMSTVSPEPHHINRPPLLTWAEFSLKYKFSVWGSAAARVPTAACFLLIKLIINPMWGALCLIRHSLVIITFLNYIHSQCVGNGKTETNTNHAKLQDSFLCFYLISLLSYWALRYSKLCRLQYGTCSLSLSTLGGTGLLTCLKCGVRMTMSDWGSEYY